MTVFNLHVSHLCVCIGAADLLVLGLLRVEESDPETSQTPEQCHHELGQLFPSPLENRFLGTGQGTLHTNTHVLSRLMWNI